jgi:hypothetical protein
MTTAPETMDDSIRLLVYEKLGAAMKAASAGDLNTARALSTEAWQHIPEPKYGWDTSYMCLRGIVNVLRGIGDHDRAIGLVNDYLASQYYSDSEAAPFFWLGTLYFEKGDTEQAYAHMDRANQKSKGRVFVDEDKRYRDFYFSRKKGRPH